MGDRPRLKSQHLTTTNPTRCCAVMDHHCPFLGNCVGAGNYRWFVAYVANVL